MYNGGEEGLFRGSGGKAPIRQKLTVWEQRPQPPEAQVRKIVFFSKITEV